MLNGDHSWVARGRVDVNVDAMRVSSPLLGVLDLGVLSVYLGAEKVPQVSPRREVNG